MDVGIAPNTPLTSIYNTLARETKLVDAFRIRLYWSYVTWNFEASMLPFFRLRVERRGSPTVTGVCYITGSISRTYGAFMRIGGMAQKEWPLALRFANLSDEKPYGVLLWLHRLKANNGSFPS